MRSRSAAYVDVGYLLAAAATRVTGSSLRRGVQTEYPDLIAALIAQIESDSELPLLRVNWYDAGSRPGGMPDATQDEIGALPRVKLRLGRLSYSGEQKGVDVRIGLDLAIQALHGVADVAYLVSGDDDLTEAVEEAQGRGVMVVVLAVPDHDGRPLAVSRHLVRAADRVLLIDAEVIDRTIKSMAIPEGLIASLAGTDETPSGDGTGPAGAPEAEPAESAARAADRTAREPAATPGGRDAAAPGVPAPPGAAPAGPGVPPTRPEPGRPRRRVRTHAGVPAGGPGDAVEVGTPADHAAVAPRPETEGAPAPVRDDAPASDPLPPSPALFARRKATELILPGTPATPGTSGDAPLPADDAPAGLTPAVIDEVAKRVVAAWCSSATPAALVELRERDPAIPADLDRALLVDLAGRGGVDDLDDVSRHAVRARFWYHVARVRMA